MLLADKASTLAPIARSPGYWATVWRRFRRDPVAMFALAIILALVLVAIFAPYIAPQDPYKGMSLRRLKPPGTPGFLLGTDELGRDMLSRLIYGARLSLFMGVTPVIYALFIGSAHLPNINAGRALLDAGRSEGCLHIGRGGPVCGQRLAIPG